MENQPLSSSSPRRVVRRESDEVFLLARLVHGLSCAVVGASNMGKSTLLRTVCDPALLETALDASLPARPDFPRREKPGRQALICLYVDCNQALERTAQGLYELILRRLSELPPDVLDGASRAALADAYHALLQPNGVLGIPLGFVQGLAAVLAEPTRRLVLVLDEFDALYRALDGQALVHLRALHDQYTPRLAYAVATDRPLVDLRQDRDAGELAELFEFGTRWIGPLDEAGSRLLAAAIAADEGATFDERDLSFLWDQAGGHPGLLEAAAHVLGAITGAPQRDAGQDRLIHQHAAEQLDADPVVLVECRKLWADLDEAERQTLVALTAGQTDVGAPALVSLHQKGLVRNTEDSWSLAGRLFCSFVRRQRALDAAGSRGVRVDVATGHVYVEGRQIPPLTELEYRLLLLLYGHLDEIVDKYEIVEGVWGQGYIDDVDDARIERLVGRLREKIEPEPKQPRYVITVRGRGYRLTR